MVRAKWDWVTLTAGMTIAALLAGGGAFHYAKANIVKDDFQRSVQLIAQDDDATWCKIAKGQIVTANDGSKHCAIHMPEFQTSKEDE